VGPDGAGKTTTPRMLAGVLSPDGGSATVAGADIAREPEAAKARLSYMPQRFGLYEDLTVAENIRFYADVFGVSRAEREARSRQLLDAAGMEPFTTRLAGKLSGGMKQKLALCCALIHKPIVLFLDEPTTGVDAVSRKEFWDMLQNLKKQGITILVSTPYMDEASQCDKVALMQNGTIMSTGTPKEIAEGFSQIILAVQSGNMYKLLQDLSASNEVDDAYSYGEYHHAVMKNNYNTESLMHYLESKGNSNIEMHPVSPSIEDCFMQLMRNKHE
jgi:ABC-type multidrug transport system ATPase subunit